jgi:hypothetical protein
MSAASSATSGPPVNVSAFIMMHGGVEPIHLYHQPEQEYILTGVKLPKNIQLFAPAILGNSYYVYNDKETNQNIQDIHKEYVKMGDVARPEYMTYCLNKIRDFEKKEISMCETHMAASGAMSHQNEENKKKARKTRLSVARAAEHLSCVEWREHDFFIQQKTYSINHDDNPPNSIMFFCQEGEIPVPIDQDFKDKFDSITSTYKFVRETTQPQGIIHFNCACDVNSRICSIQFTNDHDVPLIPFRTIYQLLLELVSSVFSRDNIHISIFDFTCDDLFFPGDYHEDDGKFRPEFISSNIRDSTLVYGTYDAKRARRLDYERSGEYALAQSGSPSPRPRDAILRVRQHETDSIRPGGAAATVPSVSPGVPPTPTLTVHLSPEVVSFVDFKPKFKAMSRSVSPVISDKKRTPIDPTKLINKFGQLIQKKKKPVKPEEVDGGSHRTHTRRCRSRHHPHVGKKVSLRHGRRRRRGTKANSTRSNRKRKTK